MDSTIIPPISYEDIWMTILLVAFGFLVLYVVLTLIFTKKKKPKANAPIDTTSVAYREGVRQKHMMNIEKLRQESIAGNLTDRELNQQLGVILRAFASEYSGFNTRPMTLSELRRNNIPKNLVDAIEGFYPIAFSNLAAKGDPQIPVQAALDVVYRWL